MGSRLTLLRIIQVLGLVGALALGSPAALALHNDGTFEIDGDVIPFNIPGNGVPGTPGEDWQTIFSCTAAGCTSSGSGSALARSFVLDPAPLSIFTGGGSKDGLNLDQWAWKDGSVPDKDNLTSGFAAVYTDPANGHRVLYFGADRLANNGDAQIGFWFFQNVVSPVDGKFVGDDGVTPATHAVGDILILSNFTNGGTATNITVYKVSAINPDGSLQFQTLGSGASGTNLACTPDNAACAATNAAETEALGPYYVPKFGTPGFYPSESFFEGGIDLTATGLGNECFPGFLVETRSSQSLTAVLKDFTLKELQKCSVSISTQVLDNNSNDVTGQTVPANSTIHDTALVTGAAGFPTPTGNVTFFRFADNTCSGVPIDNEIVTLDGTGSAASTPWVPLPGAYSYTATYGGDSLYPPAGPADCEPFEVSQFSSAVNTDIIRVSDNAAVTNQALNLAGQDNVMVRDKATVTGAGPPPTGTVTFTRFSNGNCSGAATSTETVGLDSSGQALSTPFALGPNTLSYIAVYNGDTNYTPSANSKCEPVCAIDYLTP